MWTDRREEHYLSERDEFGEISPSFFNSVSSGGLIFSNFRRAAGLSERRALFSLTH